MYELWGGGAPFTKNQSDNTLHDRSGTKVKLLGDSAKILDSLTKPPFEDTTVVWVSCTDEPTWADECLAKFTTADGTTSIGDVSDKKLNKIFKVRRSGPSLLDIAHVPSATLSLFTESGNDYLHWALKRMSRYALEA